MSPDKQSLDDLRIDRAAPSRGIPKTTFIIAALILVALVLGVIWWINRPKPAIVWTVLVQAPASGGTDKTLLNASGYVTARREATVASKVTGKVIEVLIEEGMKVEAGQVLARIDSSNVEKSGRRADAQLTSARSALSETRVRLADPDRERNRASELAEQQAPTQADLH